MANVVAIATRPHYLSSQAAVKVASHVRHKIIFTSLLDARPQKKLGSKTVWHTLFDYLRDMHACFTSVNERKLYMDEFAESSTEQ